MGLGWWNLRHHGQKTWYYSKFTLSKPNCFQRKQVDSVIRILNFRAPAPNIFFVCIVFSAVFGGEGIGKCCIQTERLWDSSWSLWKSYWTWSHKYELSHQQGRFVLRVVNPELLIKLYWWGKFEFPSAVYFEQGRYDECIEQCHKAIQVGREGKVDYKLIAK